MAGSLLLGIDIGTSSSKGVLCTPEGEILSTVTLEHETSFPRPGWVEHDPETIWWGEFVSICRQLLSGRYTGEDVGAVGVSAIGPCMLPVDASGAPLRPAVLYGIDTRATEEIAWLYQTFGEEEIFRLGGMPLSSQAVGPKILWLRNHEPEIFARTAMIHSSSDYIVSRLTGEHVIDMHTGSAFNPLFNMEQMAWDDRYADAIIDLDRLPRLLDASEVAGEVTARAAEETGLRAGTPVTAGSIDAAAESVSAGVVDPGDMMLMYGSTFFLLNLVDHYRPDKRLWTGAYALPDRRVMTGGMSTSGLIVKWFRDELIGQPGQSRAEGYRALGDEAAGISAGSEGLICLPYFAGERTPIFDPDARGVFAGLTLRHTRGHLYRAVLEGVAYGVRHHVEIMRDLDSMPGRIVAVGGGTQSDMWLQIVSDVTGRPQQVPARTIGASYGDAFMAGLGSGIIPTEDALSTHWARIDRTIEPNPAVKPIYDEYYGIYREFYERTQDLAHSLSRLGGAG
jgi:xylulokinase